MPAGGRGQQRVSQRERHLCAKSEATARTCVNQEDLAVASAENAFELRRVPLDQMPDPQPLTRLLDAVTDLLLVLERPIAIPHRSPRGPELALLRRSRARQPERRVARDGQERREEVVPDPVHGRDRLGIRGERGEVLGGDAAVHERGGREPERVRPRVDARAIDFRVDNEPAVCSAVQSRWQTRCTSGKGGRVVVGRQKRHSRRDAVVRTELLADPAGQEGLAAVPFAMERGDVFLRDVAPVCPMAYTVSHDREDRIGRSGDEPPSSFIISWLPNRLRG